MKFSDERSVDPQFLNKEQIEKRRRRNGEKTGLLSNWLGNIGAWVEVAQHMQERGLNIKGHVDLSQLNIAHIATGYAFELCIKGIAIADDVAPPQLGSHKITDIFFKNLWSSRQQEIRQCVKKNTDVSLETFFAVVDDFLCAPDRKYWNFDKRLNPASDIGFFKPDGELSLSVLLKIHRDFMSVYKKALAEWFDIREDEEDRMNRRLRNGPL